VLGKSHCVLVVFRCDFSPFVSVPLNHHNILMVDSRAHDQAPLVIVCRHVAAIESILLKRWPRAHGDLAVVIYLRSCVYYIEL